MDEIAPSASVAEELRRQLRIALPAVLSFLSYQAMNVVDTMMVSPYGEEALAGSSLALLWCWAIVIAARGVQRSLDPLISQAYGANEEGEVGRWLLRGAIGAVILALPVMAVLGVAEPALRALGQPEAALPLAGRWCLVLALGMPAMLLGGVMHAFFQSLGKLRPVTIAALLGNVVNITGNLLFMKELEMGPLGSAAATVVAEYAMLVLMVVAGRAELQYWWERRNPLEDLQGELQAQARILHLGVPMGLQQGLEVWGFSIAGLMMGLLGQTALAAHTLVLNLASLSFMFPLGIGMAGSARVGHLVGGGHPIGRAAWTAIGMGVVAMSFFAGLFSFFPGPVLGLFRPEAQVLAAGVLLLPIAGAFQLFDGVQGVAFGVLRGGGDVRVPVVINVLGYYLFGLPLGYILAFVLGWGPQGIWIGLSAALAAVAGMLLFRVRAVVRQGGLRV
ncbi:MAG TPA: MATE family efflux transporter [Myxococcota bacterium]|nr:MATE family efflux transporter [Myxococcota bacterium]HNH47338.1 MATE family efflux transporter [Myxococcota bacterium]